MTEGRIVPTDQLVHATEVTTDADPGARTFVLLHGYGATSYMWRKWVPALSRRGRVLLLDLKGFGEAPKPADGRYDPAALAEPVAGFIQEQELTRVVCIGQSLGGLIALLSTITLRQQRQDRVERLVLLAPSAYPQRLPPLVTFAKWPRVSGALLVLIGPERVLRWATRATVCDPATVSSDQISAYASTFQTPEGRRSAFAVARQLLPRDADAQIARYPTLDVPTLLLWGDRDRVIPLWVGERLATDLPRAELQVLSECGHFAPEEKPTESLQLVEAFLDDG